MQTIRRLYQYLISLVSLLTMIWAGILLLRSLVGGGQIGSRSTSLAAGLAFILVSGPVFLGHWLWAQREAATDEDARQSGVRAVFLFLILTALLLPVLHNSLALLGRLLHRLLTPGRMVTVIGGDQTLGDNLIAIGVNLAWAAYFVPWVRRVEGEQAPLARRLYRYFWSLYGLVLLLFGAAGLIGSLFDLAQGAVVAFPTDALALTLTGGVTWGATWFVVQRSLTQAEERRSLLRHVLLYLLTLSGLLGLLVSSGMVLYHLLVALLGEPYTAAEWMDALREPVRWGVIMAALWYYAGSTLRADQPHLPPDPFFTAVQRQHRYLLAFLGLMGGFIGLFGLLTFLVDAVGGIPLLSTPDELASALSALLLGLPLWWFSWRALSAEVAAGDEHAERARRSRIRRGFLYLVVFIGVLGVMLTAGSLVFHLLEALLGNPPNRLVIQGLHDLKGVALFGGLMAYHVQVLRADGRARSEALAARYARFPVLLLTGEGMTPPVEMLLAAIERQMPTAPVAVHALDAGAPDEGLSAAQAVVLPADWTATASEALALWLRGFPGHKVLLPPRHASWQLPQPLESRPPRLARQVADTLRRLAEEETAGRRPWPIWLWLLALLGGFWLFVLILSLLGPLLATGLD